MEWEPNVDDEKVRLSEQTFAKCLWLCYMNRFCALKNKYITAHNMLFFLIPAVWVYRYMYVCVSVCTEATRLSCFARKLLFL